MPSMSSSVNSRHVFILFAVDVFTCFGIHWEKPPRTIQPILGELLDTELEIPFDIISRPQKTYKYNRTVRLSDPIRTFANAIVNHVGRVYSIDEKSFRDEHYYGCGHDDRDGDIDDIEKPLLLNNATVVALTQAWNGAYYHVVIESLARIQHIRRQRPEVLERAYFHVGTTASWALGWLELLGIDRRRVLGKVNVWAPEVIYPSSVQCGQAYIWHAAARNYLRKQVHDNIGPPPDTQRRGITNVVLLNRTRGRIVSNIDDIHDLLISRGYSVEVYKDCKACMPDPRTTCGMFAAADLVVGMHGAGLSNMICSRPGAYLIEFQMDPHNACYDNVLTPLGIHRFGIQTHIKFKGKGVVEVDALRDVLQQLPSGTWRHYPSQNPVQNAPRERSRQ